MGNPASPILANIITNYIIEESVTRCLFDIPLLKCYVDDLILAVPEDMQMETLNIFNCIHDKIQFTMEKEENKTIPFLDVLVIREDSKIITNWYQKPTHSGRIINFHSAHQLITKTSVMRELKERMLRLSHEKFYEENIGKLRKSFMSNNYPKIVINKTLYRSIQPRQDNNQEVNHYYKFPYIQSISVNLRKLIKEYTNAHITFYNNKIVGNLFTKMKARTDKEQHSNLVYRIPCANCDKVYIGQTKQLLKTRIDHHRNDCKPGKILVKEKTGLAQHHFQEGHAFNFNDTIILDKENNYKKRLISEMIHINATRTNNVNIKSDTDKLSSTYAHLVEKI